ncbi:MAG: hypothetical protein R3D46_15115 [Defluviimonas denitrificans]
MERAAWPPFPPHHQRDQCGADRGIHGGQRDHRIDLSQKLEKGDRHGRAADSQAQQAKPASDNAKRRQRAPAAVDDEDQRQQGRRQLDGGGKGQRGAREVRSVAQGGNGKKHQERNRDRRLVMHDRNLRVDRPAKRDKTDQAPERQRHRRRTKKPRRDIDHRRQHRHLDQENGMAKPWADKRGDRPQNRKPERRIEIEGQLVGNAEVMHHRPPALGIGARRPRRGIDQIALPALPQMPRDIERGQVLRPAVPARQDHEDRPDGKQHQGNRPVARPYRLHQPFDGPARQTLTPIFVPAPSAAVATGCVNNVRETWPFGDDLGAIKPSPPRGPTPPLLH